MINLTITASHPVEKAPKADEGKMSEKLKKRITTTFKMHGFSLRSDACSLLVSQLMPVDEAEHDEWLEKVAEYVQKQSLVSPIVAKEHIELAIQDCIRSGPDETETVLNVINAFEVPRFVYNLERKKFLKINADSVHNAAPQLFDSPLAKANLFRDRYKLLLQRTQRHELFTPAILGTTTDDANRKFKLQPVEFLLSFSGRIAEVVVLGLLTQLREGRYYLEDPTGILQLDLSEARYHTGFHTENCFVLAEGSYEDKVFHVSGMGFPPPEPSSTSRAYFGNANSFGGPSQVSLKMSTELSKYEQENEDAVMVFLADIWLDNIKVMEKLRVLFAGYTDFPPIAFVFMGNFLSAQQGSSHVSVLKNGFKALAQLIVQFPELVERSRFIFIPGPFDPPSANILPRMSLPKVITEEFQQKVPLSIFTSNPCRIQYCTQEIVVIREDLVTKMCRNTIHFPTSGEIPDHFAKTLLCQAHLAPLPLSVCPVYWSFDRALYLYPLPDLVVTADQSSAFCTAYMDCQVMNPGSFPKNEFSFKVYIPSSRRVEDSQIPND
ncbi:DNA polymerase epsilon subunit 2 [Periplaneta americana]|uniref:DNA polymerase epsilon subunit 2 n=1 Tax=Periplaneta americana TaxID=6978 RepID=UPI0037E97C9F